MSFTSSVSSFVGGMYTMPGIGRAIGDVLGASVAKTFSKVGGTSADAYVQYVAAEMQRTKTPVMTPAVWRELDDYGAYPQGVADGMVAGGRGACITIMGGLLALAASACGLPPVAAAGLAASGLATELFIDGAIGIRQGVISERIIQKLVRTDDAAEREKLFTSLLPIMGPKAILDRLGDIFCETKDIDVAKRIKGKLYEYCSSYMNRQLRQYLNDHEGIRYEASRRTLARMEKDNESSWRDRSNYSGHLQGLFNRHFIENPVRHDCERFETVLRRKVSLWNPVSWFRPLAREKRELFGMFGYRY